MPSRSSRTPTPGASKYATLKGGSTTPKVSFGDVGGDLLSSCLDTVTTAGDAILLARTRDGGAIAVNVLSDGETVKFWCASVDELRELLITLAEAASVV